MPEFGQRAAERASEARRLAYQREADPLFFAWQAGEASKADWLAKRSEIRARKFFKHEGTADKRFPVDARHPICATPVKETVR